MPSVIFMVLLNYLQTVVSAVPTPTPIPSLPASWKDPIALSTVVIAFFSIVSVVVSFLMWNVTRRSVQVTQEILEAAHRPYLGILKLIGSINTAAPNNSIAVNLNFLVKNSGTVPAVELTALWSLAVGRNAFDVVPFNVQPIALIPEHEENLSAICTLTREALTEFEQGAPLDLSITLEYQGVTKKKYRYEQHGSYKDGQGFVLTGVKSS